MSEHVSEPSYRDPAPPPRKPKSKAGFGVAGAVGIGALLLKLGKWVFVPLKLLKFGKFWVTALSMLAMVWTQALFHGWAFALGFVLLIFVHEMGHALEIRRAGIESGWPIFIPFMGAFITLRGKVVDVLTEARIGIAGPIAGALASVLCIPLWLGFERDVPPSESLFLTLAYVGFFLNLFNLLPVRPLDGGRAFAAVSPKATIFGLVLLGGAVLFFTSPILILVAVMALGSYFAERRRRKEDAERYYSISPRARLAMAAVYFGLVVALGGGMAWCFAEMQSPAGYSATSSADISTTW